MREDPGACSHCGEKLGPSCIERGKFIPVCDCEDEVIMRRWELRKIEKTLMNMKKMLRKDLRRLKK